MVETANKKGFFKPPKLTQDRRLFWCVAGVLAVILPVSFFLLGKHFALSYWLDRLFDKPEPIKLTLPEASNIELDISGRSVVVSAGELSWHGAKYTFNKPTVVILPPCPTKSIKLPLLDGKHLPVYKSVEERWQSAIRRTTIKCSPHYFLKEILLAGSVRVESNDDTAGDTAGKTITNLIWSMPGEYFYGPDNIILINRHDRDFTLPGVFAVTSEFSQMKHSVCVTYTAKTRRIDTVCLNQDRKMQLVCGAPCEFTPTPPNIPNGFIPLANVMAPTQEDKLDHSDICPIQSLAPIKIDNAIKKRNYLALTNVRKKLESGSPVKVLFYGDSITCGGSVMEPSQSFPDLFIAGLRNRFPGNHITCINRGLGETSSNTRYSRFREEVIAQHPDLLVIEFVNDYRLSRPVIEKAYHSILTAAKSSGIETIICTPHLLNPLIFGYSSWPQMAEHPHLNLVRELAKTYAVALCDVALRWQHCRAEGTPPDWLLTDKVIHTNERGHQIYAEELLRCFD